MTQRQATAVRSLCLGLATLLGVALLANGVFMLVSPDAWYVAVPGVTTTGPFNQHFLRDIGLIFLFLGGAFLVGVTRPDLRVVFWAAPTLWLSGHALFHFWEVAVGICSSSAIPRDFPAVTLPAIIGLVLTLWAVANSRTVFSNSVPRGAQRGAETTLFHEASVKLPKERACLAVDVVP